MRILSLCLAAACLTASPPAFAADAVTLERKLVKGHRVDVEERRVTTSQIFYKTRDAKVGGAEEKVVSHQYTEEVRQVQPEILYREYAESTRSKHKPKEKFTPLKTSLHKKRVFAVGLELKPDGQFQLAKDDKEEMRFDRLPLAFLPARRQVRPRESWTVSSAPIVKAMLPPSVASTSEGSSAKVTLKSVKKVKGREIATLKVSCRVLVEKTASFPGIDFRLKGEVKWDVEEGVCVEASLAGPSVVSWMEDKDGQKVEINVESTTSWSYKAEVLEPRGNHGKAARKEGLPPPPGTFALVCELEPKHRFELKHILRCTLCGQPFDKDRGCPNGDPWTYQYCPYDGAPLSPNE